MKGSLFSLLFLATIMIGSFLSATVINLIAFAVTGSESWWDIWGNDDLPPGWGPVKAFISIWVGLICAGILFHRLRIDEMKDTITISDTWLKIIAAVIVITAFVVVFNIV